MAITAAQKAKLNTMNRVANFVSLGTLIETAETLASNASVIAKLLTGYVAGTSGAVSALAATDTILEGIQKLDGNKPDYVEASPSLTFDHSIGAKTCVIRKVGKRVTVHVPSLASSDGLGTAVAATAVAASYRPAAAVTFAILVIDNGTTRKAGQVVMGSDGVMTLSVLGAAFTNAAACGADAFAINYAVA